MCIRSLHTAGLTLALFAAIAAPARAQSFSLQTGPPAAAMPDPVTPGVKKFKDVAFVVRSVGCADRTTFRVVANATTVSNGKQRSAALTVLTVSPGVFALAGHDLSATSVVSVSGTCGATLAGALVRLVDGVYRREAVELLSRHPTQADVDRALSRGPGVRASQ